MLGAGKDVNGMHWNAKNSIVLSQVCVVVFAMLLLALDVFAYPLAKQLCTRAYFFGTGSVERLWTIPHWQLAVVFLVAVYVGSVFGWIALWKLWRLLRNIKSGIVFDEQNVRLLRAISWCCFGGAAACVVLGAAMAHALIAGSAAAAAAAFMGLLVRIIKNVFEQAIAMKSELDFTV